jgi:hypothetical protein
MRCSTKYVRLDVHRATTSARVRDSSGTIIARSDRLLGRERRGCRRLATLAAIVSRRSNPKRAEPRHPERRTSCS